MNIIEPSFEMTYPKDVTEGVQALYNIEKFARISHKSEKMQTMESWQRFIKAVVMEHGDWSVVEHAYASVTFVVDRGTTHELVRHRLCSFTQESTRFVNYTKKNGMDFIKPDWPDTIDPITSVHKWLYTWHCAMSDAEAAYKTLVEDGLSPQLARSVLPNALAATLACTSNLRNWRHFLIMRTTKETHPDVRRVTIPLLAQFQERIPILFDDIVPLQKQSIALSKPK
jgi:thymidylate synthase (FAD)